MPSRSQTHYSSGLFRVRKLSSEALSLASSLSRTGKTDRKNGAGVSLYCDATTGHSMRNVLKNVGKIFVQYLIYFTGYN